GGARARGGWVGEGGDACGRAGRYWECDRYRLPRRTAPALRLLPRPPPVLLRLRRGGLRRGGRGRLAPVHRPQRQPPPPRGRPLLLPLLRHLHDVRGGDGLAARLPVHLRVVLPLERPQGAAPGQPAVVGPELRGRVR